MIYGFILSSVQTHIAQDASKFHYCQGAQAYLVLLNFCLCEVSGIQNGKQYFVNWVHVSPQMKKW
jgi:hypothetical protein